MFQSLSVPRASSPVREAHVLHHEIPEEFLTVQFITATTKAGRQRFVHNPYAAHLKLIQQQKVQMERAQLLLF